MSERQGAGAERRLVVRAPVRLDFGGGWTDVPPYADIEGGYVCNVAIAPYATVRLGGDHEASGPGRDAILTAALTAALTETAVRPIVASVTSDFPVGAGLGGSSAVGVAAAAAALLWADERATLDSVDRADLAERSRRTEVETLGVAGGRQDHYAAAFGGALGLAFEQGRVDVRRIALTAEVRASLEARLTVVYTGQSRISGATISAVMDAYERGDDRTTDTLAAMGWLARSMADALAGGDVDRLGRLVGEHWTHQRELHPAIPTDRIDAIVAAAATAGALGAKALGASGGGCVLIVAPDAGSERVRATVSTLGDLVPFRIDDRGVEIIAT